MFDNYTNEVQMVIVQMHVDILFWSHAVDWRTLFTVQSTEKQPPTTPGVWFEAPKNYVAHWGLSLGSFEPFGREK